MKKNVSFKEFSALLHNVQVIENGSPVPLDAEKQIYLDFHSSRYFKTYKYITPFLDKNSTSILDLGLSPYFTTTLSHLIHINSVGIYGGHRLDNVQEKKSYSTISTRCEGKEYTIPVHTGYNLEKDRLPFKDDTFDIVLLLEIIEHFIMDPIHALKEMGRVLKPNGILILTTDNSNCFIKLIKLLALKSISWPYNDTTFGDRHNREYLKSEIELLLNGIGFEDVRVQLKNLSPYALGKAPLRKKAGYALSNIITCLPYFSNFKRQIFAYAKKGTLKDYYPEWLFMRREGWIETLIQ
jgi:SAM-dependent methyltransferase